MVMLKYFMGKTVLLLCHMGGEIYMMDGQVQMEKNEQVCLVIQQLVEVIL